MILQKHAPSLKLDPLQQVASTVTSMTSTMPILPQYPINITIISCKPIMRVTMATTAWTKIHSDVSNINISDINPYREKTRTR